MDLVGDVHEAIEDRVAERRVADVACQFSIGNWLVISVDRTLHDHRVPRTDRSARARRSERWQVVDGEHVDLAIAARRLRKLPTA